MRGDVTDARRRRTNKQLKIELLSQWKLEAESRNYHCCADVSWKQGNDGCGDEWEVTLLLLVELLLQLLLPFCGKKHISYKILLGEEYLLCWFQNDTQYVQTENYISPFEMSKISFLPIYKMQKHLRAKKPIHLVRRLPSCRTDESRRQFSETVC